MSILSNKYLPYPNAGSFKVFTFPILYILTCKILHYMRFRVLLLISTIPSFTVSIANIYSKKDVTEYLNFLYKNYFLVKEDFDEISVVDKLKKDFRPKIDPESYLKNGNI